MGFATTMGTAVDKASATSATSNPVAADATSATAEYTSATTVYTNGDQQRSLWKCE